MCYNNWDVIIYVIICYNIVWKLTSRVITHLKQNAKNNEY